MARRIDRRNALIWIGGGFLVVVVWALAIVGAICLWSGFGKADPDTPATGNAEMSAPVSGD